MAGNFPGGDGGGFDIFMVDNLADDNSQRQDGTMRLRNVRTMHSKNVPTEDLLFSSAMYTPSQFGQQSAPGRLDPGTMVYGIKIPGQNQVIVLGQAQTQKKGGTASGGSGTDLLGNYSKTFSNKLPINTPPDIREATTADGVKIREIKEKGEQHSFDLLDGLPSHGALFNMSGFRLPEIPNVPTAKQQNTGMMNNQMLEQMLGQIMSMAGMFQGLLGNKGGSGGGGGMGGIGLNVASANNIEPDTPMYRILQQLTPEMQIAVRNLCLLVQGLEATDGVAFFTGGVVHEETYLKNAEELLAQVTSLDDLMYVLQRLQWDSTLFGTDKLGKVMTEIETAWGVALQETDYEGNIVVTYKDPNANGALSYTEQKILISGTGYVNNYTKIFETETTTTWTGEIINMEKTLGLANGDIIIAEANTGSIGSDTWFAMNSRHRVLEVVNDTTIRFKTTGGSVPVVGNIANVSLVALVYKEPVGGAAEAIFYNTMGSSDSSPSIGGAGSGGGSGGGKGGGMGNLFGKSAGIMQDMWKRLSQGGEKTAKQLHEKVNQNKFPQTASQVAKDTKNGKSPLDKFKKSTGGGA